MHTYSICFQLFPFKHCLIADKTASFKVLQLRFACPVTFFLACKPPGVWYNVGSRTVCAVHLTTCAVLSAPGAGGSSFLSVISSCSNVAAVLVIRFMAIFQYSGLISTPTKWRRRRLATTPVVPLPANGSRTVPPSGHPANMHGSTRRSGNVA